MNPYEPPRLLVEPPPRPKNTTKTDKTEDGSYRPEVLLLVSFLSLMTFATLMLLLTM